MSKRPPRYKLVLDHDDRHRGIAAAGQCSRTFGSSRPLVAAVLVVKRYCADPMQCNCGLQCTCPQVRRWTVSRTSYTKLAADTYCDQLRGQGCAAVVVPMIEVRP
jgi:hypothetical protein